MTTTTVEARLAEIGRRIDDLTANAQNRAAEAQVNGRGGATDAP